MAILCLKGQGDPSQIASILQKELSSNNGVSCNLLHKVQRTPGTGLVIVMVFEKYYARVSNCVSLTITISSDGDTIFVDAISSGAGTGAFFKCSWGAEEKFLAVVPTILRPYNFK